MTNTFHQHSNTLPFHEKQFTPIWGFCDTWMVHEIFMKQKTPQNIMAKNSHLSNVLNI
jgi:hypothetical protein